MDILTAYLGCGVYQFLINETLLVLDAVKKKEKIDVSFDYDLKVMREVLWTIAVNHQLVVMVEVNEEVVQVLVEEDDELLLLRLLAHHTLVVLYHRFDIA